MKNLGLKIWSLLIAMGLALFVNSQTSSTVRTIVIPIEHKNLPENFVILLPDERKVQITVRGPVHLVNDLIQSPPAVDVVFEEPIERSFRRVFQSSDFSLPLGVELLEVEPNELEYVTDELIESELQVVAPTFGEVSKGVLLQAIRVEPATVLVRGPRTLLSDRDEIRTEPIDIRGIRRSASLQVRLKYLGDFFQLEEEVVDVSIDVEDLSIERTFEGLALEIRSAPGKNYFVTPERVNLVVSGPEELVQKLQESSITPFVRAKRVPENGKQFPVAAELPENISLLRSEPKSVLVKPRRAEAATSLIPSAGEDSALKP